VPAASFAVGRYRERGVRAWPVYPPLSQGFTFRDIQGVVLQ
jgi:hypothetical protein